jgi:hypothetical protein
LAQILLRPQRAEATDVDGWWEARGSSQGPASEFKTTARSD